MYTHSSTCSHLPISTVDNQVLIKGESVDDNREFDVQEKWRKKKEGKKE